MVWKSDRSYSALISNPDTDNFVQVNDLKVWSELLRTDQQSWHWSVLISNCDATQCWSEHVWGRGVKYWAEHSCLSQTWHLLLSSTPQIQYICKDRSITKICCVHWVTCLGFEPRVCIYIYLAALTTESSQCGKPILDSITPCCYKDG